MRVPSDLQQQHEKACSDLLDLGPVAQHLVSELLDAEHLRVHSVTHRVKTLPSLRRKIEDKGESYASLEDIHDLLGVRVITFFPDEVDQVAEVIKREFRIDEANSVDRRLLDPDRFGYLSLHYVAELNEERSNLTEHRKFSGRKFEIQIRSILQHAWAEIEHDLGYHSAVSVPDSVRRRFSRVAGLLEVADDEFERLREDVVAYRAQVPGDVEQAPNEVSINSDSVAALIASSEIVRAVDRDIAEKIGVEIYEGDIEMTANGRAVATRAAGLKTIGEIEDRLSEHRELVAKFAAAWITNQLVGPAPDELHKGISLFYLAYVLVLQTGSREAVVKYLDKASIGPGGATATAEILLETFESTSLSS